MPSSSSVSQPYRATPVAALCARCRRPAETFCPDCGKALCVHHLSFGGGCLSCAALRSATLGRGELVGGVFLMGAGVALFFGGAGAAVACVGVGVSSGFLEALRRRRKRRALAAHLPALTGVQQSK